MLEVGHRKGAFAAAGAKFGDELGEFFAFGAEGFVALGLVTLGRVVTEVVFDFGVAAWLCGFWIHGGEISTVSETDKAVANGPKDGGGGVVDAELAVEVAAVLFDGLNGDGKIGGDLFIALLFEEADEDLAFAGLQVGGLGGAVPAGSDWSDWGQGEFEVGSGEIVEGIGAGFEAVESAFDDGAKIHGGSKT